MNTIQIKPGQAKHQGIGELIYAAIDDMAEIILGHYTDAEIVADLQQLWQNRANRFSYDISYVAVENDKVLGAMTCGPLEKIEKAMVPTVLQILSMNKLAPFKSIMKHPKKFYSMVTMDEGNEDEYHIAMLAIATEARGKGVGQQLLDVAQAKAKEAGFNKISLTVVQDNLPALNLYQKKGFNIVGEINHKPYYLYKMRKILK